MVKKHWLVSIKSKRKTRSDLIISGEEREQADNQASNESKKTNPVPIIFPAQYSLPGPFVVLEMT